MSKPEANHLYLLRPLHPVLRHRYALCTSCFAKTLKAQAQPYGHKLEFHLQTILPPATPKDSQLKKDKWQTYTDYFINAIGHFYLALTENVNTDSSF